MAIVLGSLHGNSPVKKKIIILCITKTPSKPIDSNTGWPYKNATVLTVHFSGLCSDQQLFVSPCRIDHIFLIIITPISLNLVENFSFH